MALPTVLNRAEPRASLAAFRDFVAAFDPIVSCGTVTELVGLLIESSGPSAAIGDFCTIHTQSGRVIRAQVVGFRNGNVLSMPLEEADGLSLGDAVIARPGAATVPVGPGLLGRVIDGFGVPMDGPPIEAADYSTLLAAMARQSEADVSVIALIGERNREVRGFIELELGPEGMKKSVIVCATSDRPAALRVRACFVAVAIAEYFRDQGKNVLLVMDSVTRLAMAQREIGLAAGEPPSQKGYTPSVFQLLPKVCERAGNFDRGSITGFFTVLVEGDDFNEPICDAVRAILDGHIILSRELGAAGHYPAIQVLDSVSRLQSKLATPAQKENSRRMREALSAYRQAQDLIQLGAYAAGSNPRLDASIRAREDMMRFLRQDANEPSNLTHTLEALGKVAATLPA